MLKFGVNSTKLFAFLGRDFVPKSSTALSHFRTCSLASKIIPVKPHVMHAGISVDDLCGRPFYEVAGELMFFALLEYLTTVGDHVQGGSKKVSCCTVIDISKARE